MRPRHRLYKRIDYLDLFFLSHCEHASSPRAADRGCAADGTSRCWLYIRDCDRDPHHLHHIVKQKAGSAYERNPLKIFPVRRGLHRTSITLALGLPSPKTSFVRVSLPRMQPSQPETLAAQLFHCLIHQLLLRIFCKLGAKFRVCYFQGIP